MLNDPQAVQPADIPSRPILFDVTRLLTRLKHAAPTGIDRVDLAYLRHVLDGAPGRHAVAIVRATTRLLPGRKTDALLRAIGSRWGEEMPADGDPGLARVRRRLGGEAAADGEVEAVPARPSRLRGIADEQLFKAAAFRWAPAAAAPRNAVYLHTSHLRLDRPELFGWLAARPDIRPVFFVHDVIPIEFPEYGVPGEAERHLRRMETVARLAAAVIVNSADVGERLAALIRRQGWPRPSITVAPLGVERAFLEPVRPAAAVRPYFVICSTIEARKNHLLLLQVWRELAANAGEKVPALVIVGRRGWESESAVDLLDRCPALAGHVVEASALSTPALAELVAGACALLMPSFAEGYGIPVVEALSVGTPVVASDIPVFREIAGGHALLLHPLDGPGWLAAVRSLAAGPAATRRLTGYAPPSWADHFRIVERVLADL